MQLKTILRLPDVLAKTGISRSLAYALINKGEFPPSIQLSERAVGWDSEAVDAWINARIKAGHERAVIACQGVVSGETFGKPTVGIRSTVPATNRGGSK